MTSNPLHSLPNKSLKIEIEKREEKRKNKEKREKIKRMILLIMVYNLQYNTITFRSIFFILQKRQNKFKISKFK